MALYGEEIKYSAAYMLFHIPYTVRVADSETMDVNDFEYFGLSLYKDNASNLILAQERVPKSLTISEIAYLKEQGAELELLDPHDATPIYRRIMEHLLDWLYAMEDGCVDWDNVPLQGLAEFDKLACALVPIGRRYDLLDDRLRNRVGNAKRFRLNQHTEQDRVSHAVHSSDTFNAILRECADEGIHYKWGGTRAHKAMLDEPTKDDKYKSMWD